MQPVDADLSVRYLLRPLEPYLARPEVSDLTFARAGMLHLDTPDGWQLVADAALTFDWARSLVTAAATAEGKQIGAAHPFLAASLPDGLRLQAVVPPACRQHQVLLCLRTEGEPTEHLDQFEWSLDDVPLPAKYQYPNPVAKRNPMGTWGFKYILAQRLNMLVIGASNVTKAAMIDRIVYYMPLTERIVTIGDDAQRELAHRNVAYLFYGADLDIAASSCVRQAFRMRPDRLILNECRGAEVFDFLQLLLSGHRGAATTMHATSSEEAIERLALMARMHPAAQGLEHPLLKQLIHRSFDLVVLVRRKESGPEELRLRRSYMARLEFLHRK